MPNSKEKIAISNMQTLKENPYPGDGIIVGCMDSGYLVQVLWFMGENERLRNRKLILKSENLNSTVISQRLKDFGDNEAELLSYNAMRRYERYHFVSNGSVDPIIHKYSSAKHRTYMDLPRASHKIIHMSDAPIYTPRIIGVTNEAERSAVLSIISRDPLSGIDSLRSYFEYNTLIPGFGMCIHTYDGDEDPLPLFSRDPFLVPINGDVKNITDYIWEALNPYNRVAIVTKTFAKDVKTEFEIKNARP